MANVATLWTISTVPPMIAPCKADRALPTQERKDGDRGRDTAYNNK
jgi:hypothetical protein